MKLSFKVLDEGTTANQNPYSKVEFTVTINDNYTQTAILDAVGDAYLSNQMFVYSETYETQPLTFSSAESNRTYQSMTFLELDGRMESIRIRRRGISKRKLS